MQETYRAIGCCWNFEDADMTFVFVIKIIDYFKINTRVQTGC